MEDEIPYSIEVKKKKNSSAVIRDGKILLRISAYLSKKQQLEHIDELLRRMRPLLEKKQHSPYSVLLCGEGIIPWDGKTLQLYINHETEEQQRGLFKKSETPITEQQLQKKLLSWTRKEWTHEVETLLFAWKVRMGLEHISTQLIFKNLKRKWGTCSRTGEITIAIKTLLLPYHLF